MSNVTVSEHLNKVTEDGLSCAEVIREQGYQAGMKVLGELTIRHKERDQPEQVIKMKNVITLDASVLVARLFKDKSDPTNGAFALAVGTGHPLWDPFNPPVAANTQTQLEAEILRKIFSSTNFITPLGAVSPTPTNIVDFTTFFTEAEAVGPLVEMGLVGGDATLAPNTGTLINFRTFKVINKSNTSTLSITWRLTF